MPGVHGSKIKKSPNCNTCNHLMFFVLHRPFQNNITTDDAEQWKLQQNFFLHQLWSWKSEEAQLNYFKLL